MAVLEMDRPLKAEDHAQSMANYIQTGTEQAYAIGNRGPIRMDANGKLEKDILDAYWEHGFYVFEDVVGTEELEELLELADDEAAAEEGPVETEMVD